MPSQAALMFDSERPTVDGVVGQRGISAQRSLWFRGPRVSVDVVVNAHTESLQVIQGQVFDHQRGAALRDVSVQLAGHDDVVSTNEYGEFALSTVTPSDTHTLRVASGEDELLCTIPAPETDV